MSRAKPLPRTRRATGIRAAWRRRWRWARRSGRRWRAGSGPGFALAPGRCRCRCAAWPASRRPPRPG
ncbi:hypothetical protein AL465_004780 [Bordetella pertussis 18323]|nr:hypothetical protein AL465_004780 [Bordetella pertussis 18323]